MTNADYNRAETLVACREGRCRCVEELTAADTEEMV